MGANFFRLDHSFNDRWVLRSMGSDAARNKRSQSEMLKVIENTNRNVYDLSRILQPLGKSQIYLGFKPNCVELKEFCDAAIQEAKREEPLNDHRIAAFSVRDIDWSKWPDRTNVPTISLLFFKDRGQAKAFLGGGCITCKSEDMSFELTFNASVATALNRPTVLYVVDNSQLYIGVTQQDITPNVHNDKMLFDH